MNLADQSVLNDQPIWARPDVFPPKPSDQGRLGFLSTDGGFYDVEDEEALRSIVRNESSQRASLVWTEESDYCVPVEEVAWLAETVLVESQEHAAEAYNSAKTPLWIFGGLLGFFVYRAWESHPGASLLQILSNQSIGALLLMFTIFALLPFYEAWKERKRVAGLTPETLIETAPEARFDIWMASQKGQITKCALLAMAIIGVIQLYVFNASGRSIVPILKEASLVKLAVLAGDHWRYLTAPFLHGNPIHWFFNASALWFLGRRVEALARWPHVLNVLVLSGLAGGICSVSLIHIYPQPSVGASGAIVGLLGFLLVFEFTHRGLVPKSARRRLLAMVGGLIVIGFVGVKMIDNGAHAGGLLAGMAYSFIVFPPTSSPQRPRTTFADKVVAGVSGVIIASGALLTASRLFSIL